MTKLSKNELSTGRSLLPWGWKQNLNLNYLISQSDLIKFSKSIFHNLLESEMKKEGEITDIKGRYISDSNENEIFYLEGSFEIETETSQDEEEDLENDLKKQINFTWTILSKYQKREKGKIYFLVQNKVSGIDNEMGDISLSKILEMSSLKVAKLRTALLIYSIKGIKTAFGLASLTSCKLYIDTIENQLNINLYSEGLSSRKTNIFENQYEFKQLSNVLCDSFGDKFLKTYENQIKDL